MGIVKPIIKAIKKMPAKFPVEPTLVKVNPHSSSAPQPIKPTAPAPLQQPNCNITQVCVGLPIVGQTCVNIAHCTGPIIKPVFE